MFHYISHHKYLFNILLLQIVFFNFSFAASNNSFKKEVVKLRKEKSVFLQMKKSNCIYEIYNELSLGDSILQLPDNVTLSFKGGRLVNGTIYGNNAQIDSECKQIFSNVCLKGKWSNNRYYPEWFGAIGDGVCDDTNYIKAAMLAAEGAKLVFQQKIYIINVLPGVDNQTQRFVFSGCKCTEMLGNGTVIKLGNNDNCNLYKNKGFGAIFSVYALDSFLIRGITFDFNYKFNPIFQTTGIRQGIQENTQQNALLFRQVRKVVVDNCCFIGHSGTNCIDYSDVDYNKGDKLFEVTIKNCSFLDSGGKSYYFNGRNYVDAYHDSSTIAIHYRGKNHNTPLVVNIVNNFFEGNGANAFNAVEADASEMNFKGNTICKYAVCLYPCANIYNSKIAIDANRFLNVSHGIVFWLRGNDNDSDQYGYEKIKITNNICNIDMGFWGKVQRYDNYQSSISNRYGFILTTSWNNISVKNILVSANTIKYFNTNSVSPLICSKATINFESVGKNVSMMRCHKLEIIGNNFFNSVNRILYNSLFQDIDTLIFDNNIICNPFSVRKVCKTNNSLIYLNHLKADSPMLDDPTIGCFVATNNIIRYNKYNMNGEYPLLLKCDIKRTKSRKGAKLIIKNNKHNIPQRYATIDFLHKVELFETIEIEDITPLIF